MSSKEEIDKAIQLNNTVVKLQAIAKRKFATQIANQLRKSQNLTQFRCKDELAFQEFSKQLKAKRITPEQFYRMCDINDEQMVSPEMFANMIDRTGLTLTTSQIQRIKLILDEDFNGVISHQEYIRALQSYHIAQEQHQIDFESEVKSLVCQIIYQKNLTCEKFFDLCDRSKQDTVSFEDFKLMLEKVQPTVQSKVVKMIQKIVCDQNQQVTKDIFLKNFASQTPRFRSNRQIDFEQEEELQGDEAIPIPQQRPKTAQAASKIDDNKAFAFVNKIEHTLKSVQSGLIQVYSDADFRKVGYILIKNYKQTLLETLMDQNITDQDVENCLQVLDVNKNGRIEKDELILTLKKVQMQSKVQSQRPATSAVQSKLEPAKPQTAKKPNFGNLDFKSVIEEIEKLSQSKIESKIQPFLDAEYIGLPQLIKLFSNQRGQSSVPKELFDRLASLCQPQNDQIKMSAFIIQLSKLTQKFDLQVQFKIFIETINSPVRQTLRDKMMDYDDGIQVEEFISSFQGEKLSNWHLSCLYYTYATYINQQFQIDFEKFAQLIEKEKGISSPPTANIKEDNHAIDSDISIISQTSSQIARKKTIKVVESTDRKTYKQFYTNRLTQQEIKKRIINQRKQYLPKDPKTLQNPDLRPVGANPIKDKCIVDQNAIFQNFQLYHKLYNYFTDVKFVDSFVDKAFNWLNTVFEDNQEEMTSKLLSVCRKEMAKDTKIQNQNSLMLRVFFEQTNKFNVIEQIFVSLIFAKREDLNHLKVDWEYVKEFFQITLEFTDKNQEAESFRFAYALVEETKKKLQIIELLLVSAEYAKELKQEFACMEDDYFNCSKFQYLTAGLIDQVKEKKVYNDFKLLIQDQNQLAADQNKNHKVTYYDFKNFCAKIGLISQDDDIESEWMVGDFSDYLDPEGDAYVQIDYLYDFLSKNGFDFTKNVISFKKEKIEQDAETYKLEDKDFFCGCSTILNSDIAAAKRAQQLFEQCQKNNKQFVDPDFGPQDDDDEQNKFNACCYDQTWGRKTGLDPKEFKWKHAKDQCAENEHPHFVFGDSSSNDVKQGMIGNCWFISALSVLATQDDYVYGIGQMLAGIKNKDQLIVDKDLEEALTIGVYPPIFHKFRKIGLYVIRFFKDFNWRYVIVDDRFPINASELVYAKCKEDKEIWVQLIEKAYSKLMGNYQVTTAGSINDGLVDLTGFVCETIELQTKQGDWKQELEVEEFWERLKKYKNDLSMMGCSRSGAGMGDTHHLMIDDEDTGILYGHAYAILDVIELMDPSEDCRKKMHRILRIRNPHGQGEWLGKWGENSVELEKYKDLIDNYIQGLPEEERFNIEDDDGIFLMNYKSFRQVFNKLFVAVSFEDDWEAVFFKCKWDKLCNGGIPASSDPKEKINYMRNPQFVIQADKDTEVLLSLSQNDGRCGRQTGNFEPYPFKSSIYELKPDQEKITDFSAPQFKTSPLAPFVSTSIRLNLESGKRYAVIAAAKLQDKYDVDFQFSIYFQGDLDCMNIRRVDRQDRYYFVEEQYHKRRFVENKWLKDWIRNNCINQVITGNSAGQSQDVTLVGASKNEFGDEEQLEGDECIPVNHTNHSHHKRANRKSIAQKRKQNLKHEIIYEDQQWKIVNGVVKCQNNHNLKLSTEARDGNKIRCDGCKKKCEIQLGYWTCDDPKCSFELCQCCYQNLPLQSEK